MAVGFAKYFVHIYKALKVHYKAARQSGSRNRLYSTRMQRDTEFCCNISLHLLGHNWEDVQNISKHSLQYTEKTF